MLHQEIFAVNHDDVAAWIENSAGETVPVSGQLEFGRDSGHIRIGSPKASRRHAMINPQSRETRIEYWFIDLGSANGSFVNGRRVVQPMPLKDGDRIRLVDREFVFHLVERPPSNEEAPQSELTMLESRTGRAWLLVADIVDSTPLIRTVPAEQLAGMMGRWLRECANVIEAADGSVNRYLGDGFLAYWMGDGQIASLVTGAICKLHWKQSRSELAFRVVLHHGEITISSEPTQGMESLLSPEVHYIFRAEKIAAETKQAVLLTEAAQALIGERLPLLRLPGDYELKGFPGRHIFFALDESATIAPA